MQTSQLPVMTVARTKLFDVKMKTVRPHGEYNALQCSHHRQHQTPCAAHAPLTQFAVAVPAGKY
eukprot:3770784-Amphidinium_carterae.1